MTGPNPSDYVWWLAARASGIVALGLVTASVGIGLLMASKLLRRPGLNRVLVKVHEHLALTGLVAIGVHGVTLLGDRWLNPGVAGITVPFAMSYRPLFTGLGIVAGYLAALARAFVLCEAPNRRAPVAKAPPGDGRRLPAGRGARARRRHRRLDAVAADVHARHRRPDPLPVRGPRPAAPQERGRPCPRAARVRRPQPGPRSRRQRRDSPREHPAPKTPGES